MNFFFQHPNYLIEKEGSDSGLPDLKVVQRDIGMALKAEDLGYDAIWSVEHHFTGYTMVPDVTQVLAYIAARTKHVEIGSGAIILPWHNPVRATEAIALLDNLSEGRFILGLGRGLGKIEFDGIGVPMGESRERFIEAAQIVLNGLENGYVEFDGKHYKQPKRWIRPAPTRSFKGRSYSAAVSPESLEIMARLGVGILITPQKPWETTIKELDTYRQLFGEINSAEPPKPIVTCQVYVDRDADRAKERGLLHLGNYYRTVMKHYELASSHLDNMKGYEYYKKISSNINRLGQDDAAVNFANLQVYGTPEECIGRVETIRDMLDCDRFNAIFSYSTMDDAEANANMQLWTDAVLPKVKAMGRKQKTEERAIA
jgi:alkanesulfonate monooxygenase SsuD/methylene tetrahydromethanopterin reductase-like flavin-dependent oxidoreductase (luciferase family)